MSEPNRDKLVAILKNAAKSGSWLLSAPEARDILDILDRPAPAPLTAGQFADGRARLTEEFQAAADIEAKAPITVGATPTPPPDFAALAAMVRKHMADLYRRPTVDPFPTVIAIRDSLPQLADALERAAGRIAELERIIVFAVSRYCDPHSLATDPAAARLLELATVAGLAPTQPGAAGTAQGEK